MTSPTTTSADELVKRLVEACKMEGLNVDVYEPSTRVKARIKVFSPNGNGHMDEILTMRPDGGNVLTWYWSWDCPGGPAPVGPAADVEHAVKRIKNVVAYAVM